MIICSKSPLQIFEAFQSFYMHFEVINFETKALQGGSFLLNFAF